MSDNAPKYILLSYNAVLHTIFQVWKDYISLRARRIHWFGQYIGQYFILNAWCHWHL